MQQRAAQDTIANLSRKRPKTKKEIIHDAGYAPTIGKQPHLVFESKGFKELVQEYLPDDLIAKKHRELITLKKIDYLTFPKKTEDDIITAAMKDAGLRLITIKTSIVGKLAFYSVTNERAAKDGVDMAYKLKGQYAPEKKVNLNLNANLKKNPKVAAYTKEYEKNVKKALLKESK